MHSNLDDIRDIQYNVMICSGDAKSIFKRHAHTRNGLELSGSKQHGGTYEERALYCRLTMYLTVETLMCIECSW